MLPAAGLPLRVATAGRCRIPCSRPSAQCPLALNPALPPSLQSALAEGGIDLQSASAATAEELTAALAQAWGVQPTIVCNGGWVPAPCAAVRERAYGRGLANTPFLAHLPLPFLLSSFSLPAMSPRRMVYEVRTCFDVQLKPIDCPVPTSCPKTAQQFPEGAAAPPACALARR